MPVGETIVKPAVRGQSNQTIGHPSCSTNMAVFSFYNGHFFVYYIEHAVKIIYFSHDLTTAPDLRSIFLDKHSKL